MIKLLKKLKDIVDPNYWASKIGDKSGLYDKAEKSSIRKWALGLEGWKWWAWQIGGGILFVVIVEFLLNKVGMTILPWR
tara:strand:- start:212 stop:448 length:237 start_codon:yes stop_codon:yes gene_type:complete